MFPFPDVPVTLADGRNAFDAFPRDLLLWAHASIAADAVIKRADQAKPETLEEASQRILSLMEAKGRRAELDSRLLNTIDVIEPVCRTLMWDCVPLWVFRDTYLKVGSTELVHLDEVNSICHYIRGARDCWSEWRTVNKWLEAGYWNAADKPLASDAEAKRIIPKCARSVAEILDLYYDMYFCVWEGRAKRELSKVNRLTANAFSSLRDLAAPLIAKFQTHRLVGPLADLFVERCLCDNCRRQQVAWAGRELRELTLRIEQLDQSVLFTQPTPACVSLPVRAEVDGGHHQPALPPPPDPSEEHRAGASPRDASEDEHRQGTSGKRGRQGDIEYKGLAVSKNHRRLLVGALKEGAVDEDSRQPAKVVVRQGLSSEKHASHKRDLSFLVKVGLLRSSGAGCGAGYWLTQDGQAMAERERNSGTLAA
jgi:hypothetical protein